MKRACELAWTLGPAKAGFRDVRHEEGAKATGRGGRFGTVIQVTFSSASSANGETVLVNMIGAQPEKLITSRQISPAPRS